MPSTARSGGFVVATDLGAAVCVLGSISVTDADQSPVAIGGEKPRRLLAMSVLPRSAVVAADRLIDAIGGDDEPTTAAATLRSYVSRLRRVLPPPARVVSEPPGPRPARRPPASRSGRARRTWIGWRTLPPLRGGGCGPRPPPPRWPPSTGRWPSGR